MITLYELETTFVNLRNALPATVSEILPFENVSLKTRPASLESSKVCPL